MTIGKVDSKKIIHHFDKMMETRLHRRMVFRFFANNVSECNRSEQRAEEAHNQYSDYLGSLYTENAIPQVFFPGPVDLGHPVAQGTSSEQNRQSTQTYTYDMSAIFEQLATDFADLPNLTESARKYHITLTRNKSFEFDSFFLVQLLTHKNAKAFSILLIGLGVFAGLTSATGICLIILSLALLLVRSRLPEVVRMTVASENLETSHRVYDSPSMSFL